MTDKDIQRMIGSVPTEKGERMMPDRKTVIDALEHCADRSQKMCNPTCPYYDRVFCESELALDALVLLKEQQNLLGIQQTADGITFLSTGTAKQGEERGLMLGKLTMHEWLRKELLYRGLLTDEIRVVFDEAKRI